MILDESRSSPCQSPPESLQKTIFFKQKKNVQSHRTPLENAIIRELKLFFRSFVYSTRETSSATLMTIVINDNNSSLQNEEYKNLNQKWLWLLWRRWENCRVGSDDSLVSIVFTTSVAAKKCINCYIMNTHSTLYNTSRNEIEHDENFISQRASVKPCRTVRIHIKWQASARAEKSSVESGEKDKFH